MNIQEAKEEIKAALQAYTQKDETGMYVYPPMRQRPILLMGPPGIGKTAIMQQIAGECGTGLVAYTMTHHTRQSAIGLPRIVETEYEGERYAVTEYTLSEIVASVYECRKKTGCDEGILFLDEINCVSETLAPVMLQLLQNKQFGTHRIPRGWLIVAAGNPPEYNRSVREFDVATLDRVRRIDVEADADCWLAYAAGAHIHGAVTAYLQMHPDRFYQISQENGEKRFVTARGWEDMSRLIQSCEETGREVGVSLMQQFLQDPREASRFAAYYRIYMKYGQDYGLREVLIRDPEETKADVDEDFGKKDGRESRGDSRESEKDSEGKLSYRQKCALLSKAGLEERITVIAQLAHILTGACGKYRDRKLLLEQFEEAGRKFGFLSAGSGRSSGQGDPKTPKAGEPAEPGKNVGSQETGMEPGKNTGSREAAAEPGKNTGSGEAVTELEKYIASREKTLLTKVKNDLISFREEQIERRCLRMLGDVDERSRRERRTDPGQIRALLDEKAGEERALLEREAAQTSAMIRRAFLFAGRSFAQTPETGEEELFLLVSYLARDRDTALFLTEFPDNEVFLYGQDGRGLYL